MRGLSGLCAPLPLKNSPSKISPLPSTYVPLPCILPGTENHVAAAAGSRRRQGRALIVRPPPAVGCRVAPRVLPIAHELVVLPRALRKPPALSAPGAGGGGGGGGGGLVRRLTSYTAPLANVNLPWPSIVSSFHAPCGPSAGSAGQQRRHRAAADLYAPRTCCRLTCTCPCRGASSGRRCRSPTRPLRTTTKAASHWPPAAARADRAQPADARTGNRERVAAGRRGGGAAAPYTDSSGKMNLPDPVCGSSGSAAAHAGAE